MRTNVNINDIAKYTTLRLIQNGNTISPLKLQKILYYIQAWSLVYFNEEPLFENQPEAWANGPGYREIREVFQALDPHSQMTLIDLGIREDELPQVLADLHTSMNISDERWILIEEILVHYGCMSQERLSLLAISQAPWNDARKGESPFGYSGQKISLKSMCDYYSKAIAHSA